ncbi:MAG: sensor histidine kinase [Alphaproteobacteria bacterium]|nr:sensor histidine kinase [Alphaproteobacteria bacterium]
MYADTLTRRLFFRIVPIIVIAIGLIGLLSYASAVHETNDTYDAQMSNDASLLWTLVKDEIGEDADRDDEATPHLIDFSQDRLSVKHLLPDPADFRDESPDRMLRVWKNGKLLMYSNTALPMKTPPAREGFTDTDYKGENWRVLSVAVPQDRVFIQVGEKMAMRDDLIADIFLDLFTPLLLLTPLIAGLVWGGIRSGLDTIRELGGRILQRSPDDLSPIDLPGLPDDLRPLVLSVNDLLHKLRESLEAERHFTDHAAHQLRTPLAGIRLQLQLLSQAEDVKERAATIAGLLESTDRAARHVTQLLRAARIAHTEMNIRPVSLYETCASVVAGMGAMVTAKKMNVSLSGAEDAMALADETLLRLLVENLFENALKYTPEGGDIHLTVGADGLDCTFVVEDSGPGIAPEERENAFKRFYRAGAPATEGSGIGLSIVSEIAHRFAGSVRLETPESGHGLRVRVILPGPGRSAGTNEKNQNPLSLHPAAIKAV